MSHNQSSRTTIPDPYRDKPVRDRHGLMTYISTEAFQFLGRRLLQGTPGAMNAVMSTMLSKLIAELETRGFTQWEPDIEPQIVVVLADLNFRKPVEVPVAKPKRKAKA